MTLEESPARRWSFLKLRKLRLGAGHLRAGRRQRRSLGGAGGEWNDQRFEDNRGHGFISFDGWRWVEVELCGHFAREYPRPGHHNWSSMGGDGYVDYPLALTKVILELRDRVVYVTDLVPVKDETVRLSELMAVY